LHLASQIDFPKVRTFLESIARGSKNSKASYEIGLKHLQCFLNSISSSNNNNNSGANDYYSCYDIETILLAQQSNKLNVYELLDSFVSFLVNMPHQPPILLRIGTRAGDSIWMSRTTPSFRLAFAMENDGSPSLAHWIIREKGV